VATREKSFGRTSDGRGSRYDLGHLAKRERKAGNKKQGSRAQNDSLEDEEVEEEDDKEEDDDGNGDGRGGAEAAADVEAAVNVEAATGLSVGYCFSSFSGFPNAGLGTLESEGCFTSNLEASDMVSLNPPSGCARDGCFATAVAWSGRDNSRGASYKDTRLSTRFMISSARTRGLSDLSVYFSRGLFN
jgi:hypothetical protein